MGRRSQFKQEDFFQATLKAINKNGPAGTTIAAIGRELNGPVGSIYHRYSSLQHILAETWLCIAESFQTDFMNCLADNKGLEAALNTPRYARQFKDQARFLLCYNREEFIADPWPLEVRERAGNLKNSLGNSLIEFVKNQPGKNDQKKKACIELALIQMPLAATKPWLHKGQKIPAFVDEFICSTYKALMKLEE